MKTKKIVLFALLSILVTGCASSTMIVENPVKESISPIGIFVCSSTQIIDDKDIPHRDFVIQNSFDTFEKLLGSRYKILNLNNIVPYDKVFKKPFGSFYINDKKIGEYAKANNCNTYLIVYYAETEVNFSFILPDIGLNKSFLITYMGNPKKRENGFVMHSNCSLYGWLFRTDDRKAIKRSHSVLEAFDDYVDIRNTKEPDITIYALFLSQITNKMFYGLK